MKIQVINKSSNQLPLYATKGSAAVDLKASFSELDQTFIGEGFRYNIETKTIILDPKGRILIPTDTYCSIPEGYELQIRPRSGLAIKSGIGMTNSPGTIDSDYRGNIGVILINHGLKSFEIKTGDRIAQAVLNKVEQIEWVEVTKLDDTDRGSGGFGHTGK